MNVMQHLSGLIGPATAAQLCERLAGTTVYIPAIPSASSRLVLAIGHGPAARLCDALAGACLCLPSRTSQERTRRHEAVLYDFRRGLSVQEVATRHGITDRHVRRMLKAQEPPPCL
jgi:DNA-binding NarL/FixJ family response regulator